MSDLENEILRRIKIKMKEKKVIQEELAKELSLHQYDVSRLLNGKPFPSMDQLNIIAKFLDCSIYYLIGVQEESYRELTPDTRKVADAYTIADPAIKAVVKRVLDIKN